MFPSTQAHRLRYKVILSDCRKQSQEMEMHCAASSATSGYLFRQIFLHGNPLPSITLPGSWKNKPAVSCNLLRLQGGITSLLSHPTRPPSPPQRSSSKQKLVWGIQLVNLTLDTLPLVCNTDMPFLHRSSHNKLSERRERERKSELFWVRRLIMSLKRTARHLASIMACDGLQGSSAAGSKGHTTYRHMLHSL